MVEAEKSGSAPPPSVTVLMLTCSIFVASSTDSAAAFAFLFSSSSLLSVSMEASITGVNVTTLHLGDDASTALTAAGSRESAGAVKPNMNARRLAAAMMNCV